MSMALLRSLVASPCCNPDLSLDEALLTYHRVGYRKFEAFSSWVQSRLDPTKDPTEYVDAARRHGIAYASYHLPPIGEELETDLARAIQAARFAARIGASVVLFKADSRPLYLQAGHRFLDEIKGIAVTPAIQNHFGTAVSTLDDVKEVHEGLADPRMKAVLEVGHFHSAGVHWQEACEYLGERIALVHVKDQVARQSVPFGTGEIDLPGLFRHLAHLDFGGDVVVEMEVEDSENTLQYMREAREYLRRIEEDLGP